MKSENNIQGFIFGLIAFLIWGFFPIYWKKLSHYDAFELLGHRVVWGFAFISIYLGLKGELGKVKNIFFQKDVLKAMLASTFFIFINWFIFIWAVNKGHLLEVSLGYFTSPLVNIFLGTLLLKERLRKLQWFAIILSVSGGIILGLGGVKAAWITAVVAISFGLYGLVRKKVNLPSSIGLCFEMFLVSLPMLAYFIGKSYQNEFMFLNSSFNEQFLVIGAGVMTVIPLLSYGKAVVNLKLSTLGFLQYIAPSIQFLLGVFLYDEDFSKFHQISFSLIWLALFIYSLEGVYQVRKKGRMDA